MSQTSRPRAYYHNAELLIELQQYEESMKSIEKALELCEEGNLAKQTTLSKGDIYITFCKIHLLLGQHDKADEYVKQILTEDWPKNNLDRSVSLFQLGSFFSVNGKLEHAMKVGVAFSMMSSNFLPGTWNNTLNCTAIIASCLWLWVSPSKLCVQQKEAVPAYWRNC